MAERATNKMNRKVVDGMEVQEVALDPVTLSLILSAITTSIKLIKRCRAEREQASGDTYNDKIQMAVSVAHNPMGRDRRVLRRILRRKMGWIRFWREGGKTYNAILETGKDVTEDEMREMFAEV